jgi:hypothetical protein
MFILKFVSNPLIVLSSIHNLKSECSFPHFPAFLQQKQAAVGAASKTSELVILLFLLA